MAQTLALPAGLPPLSRALMALTFTVLAWELRHRSRKSLGKLDNHMLRDIGLDPLAAQTETQKPFWRC